jgi:hypothetical protein
VQNLFQRMTSLPFAGIAPAPPSLAAFVLFQLIFRKPHARLLSN